jgi:dihydroorotate dehydrogenase (fumarate)
MLSDVETAMDLSTRYLGLTLAHPFIAGASPLGQHLDTAKRLEDGGAAAIVLHSLFEEQITMAESGRIHQMDPLEQEFAAPLAAFPPPEHYALSPDAYLEHLRRVKAAVAVPVIASLNGMTPETWLTFATRIEQAGADALELNMYEVAIDPTESSAVIERDIRNIAFELKRRLRLPIAVKLSPYFTAFADLAHQLDRAGADGLVLFNRFYQPDIDVDAMAAVPRVELSTSAELPLRLRWVAMLHSRLRCSLAVTGGVAVPSDGIKAILAGADAVQMVSAILRHGPAYFSTMRDGLTRWMESKGVSSLRDVRGRVDASMPNCDIVERANYLRTLQSWTVGATKDSTQ